MGSKLYSGALVAITLFIAAGTALDGNDLAFIMCLVVCLQELRWNHGKG